MHVFRLHLSHTGEEMKIQLILQKLWDHAIHLLGGIVVSVAILMYVRRCLKDRKNRANKGQQEEEEGSHGRRGERKRKSKKNDKRKNNRSQTPKHKRKEKKPKRIPPSCETDIDDAQKYQALEEGGRDKNEKARNGRSRNASLGRSTGTR